MEIDDILGVCGPSCANCPAYKATRSGPADLKLVASQWTNSLNRVFIADDLVCDGCRVEGGRKSTYCADCEIRNCAVSHGHESCGHCEKGPCDKIVSSTARIALAKIKETLSNN
jgi:hypothetical protein